MYTRPLRIRALTFGEAVSRVFSNATNYSDRAPRSEYWWFTLLEGVVAIVGLFLFALAFESIGFVAIVPLVVVGLVFFIPLMAVVVRRLHDTDRSGAWFFWLGIVPLGATMFSTAMVVTATTIEDLFRAAMIDSVVRLVAMIPSIILVILLALPGDPGPNRYGPSPLQPR